MYQGQHVTCTIDDSGIASVELCNPPVNALGANVDRELGECFQALEVCGQVRCAILHGQGKCFCAGTDLRETLDLPGERAADLAAIANATLNRIEAAPFPVIAAVGGPALGGGLELALCCDFIVASTRATFGFPEVTIGAMPVYGGTQRLPRAVGMAQAKMMVFTGQAIDAQRAYQVGLVQQVVQPDDLLPRARELAQVIAANAPVSVRASKRAMAGALETPLQQGLAAEAAAAREVFASADRDEGIAAFLEKRAPRFHGC